MAVGRHAHPQRPAGYVLIVEPERAREARELRLIRRLLEDDVDEKGEQAEREGETDDAADDGKAHDEREQQCRSDRVQREVLPFGNGRRHGEREVWLPAPTFKGR